MSWQLPPLNSVRAFEAAGRNLSFTLAARELNVTPGAVSRQIKLLEEFVGVRLFRRANREVKLTAAGSAYLEVLTDAFAHMNVATARIVAAPADRALRLSCTMTFTLRWLLPRLMSFHASQPGRDLQLTTALRPIDFRTDDFDAAVRLGKGEWPNSTSHRLFSAELVPVCSPNLLKEGPPLRTVADLAQHTLLHSTARMTNWPIWLNGVGAAAEAGHEVHFESSSLAYQAAIEGMGVAIGQLQLVLDDLASGRLAIPFKTIVLDGDSYYLFYPTGGEKNKALQQFRDWILQETRLGELRTEAVRRDCLTSSKGVGGGRSVDDGRAATSGTRPKSMTRRRSTTHRRTTAKR